MKTRINVPIAMRNVQRLSPATRAEYWRRTLENIALGEWFTGNSPSNEERGIAIALILTLNAIDDAHVWKRGLTKTDR